MLLRIGRDLLVQAGLLATVAGGLYAWHRIDKGSAVHQAVVEYVARVELAAAEAESAALRERIETLEVANARFAESEQISEQEVRNAERQFDEYLAAVGTGSPGSCVVTPDLLDVLRAD